ncbi:MAG: YifB family Mg chelatase-like AAA ATPase [Actinobacteria bacterium]|nr:YifB family Mg chelatase-like AAA ATPase [Actinomycetota bacterium]
MLAKVNGSAVMGIESLKVQIEVDINMGLPCFEIVGLPDAAIKESRTRVKSAIKNSIYEFPNSRIYVNMAPADIKKTGPAFDLPIALGILEASEQFSNVMGGKYIAVGELSLDGHVRDVQGVLAVANGIRRDSLDFMIVPRGNAEEAALVDGITVYGVSSLREAVCLLEGSRTFDPVMVNVDGLLESEALEYEDLSEVRGQEAAKRALEISAAGSHNLLMVGPPGSGKSMLARRIPGILPGLNLTEALEITCIHSVAGRTSVDGPLVTKRPFRTPHSSISVAGLAGGGFPLPKPGEISLAHNGILYLDEFTLFSRSALESLRSPIEEGEVTIVRSMSAVRYPCRFGLVASMNPCPCGYYGDPGRSCSCSAGDIRRYLNRISGPLLDRMDLQVEVPRLSRYQLEERSSGEPSSVIRGRVSRARALQEERFSGSPVMSNSGMTHSMIERFCRLSKQSMQFLGNAVEKLGLSARSYDRALKVARTIADLEGSEKIKVEHLAEAVQYRNLERIALSEGTIMATKR